MKKHCIRPAAVADLPAIEALFARARSFMAATGNPNQWPDAYPPEALTRKEIAEGVCFVLEGEQGLLGVFSCLPGEEPTYRVITDGAWPEGGPYLTIHRLAAAEGAHGVAAACVRWCAARGLPLRADTHADNRVMQHLLEKTGFERCGRIFLANGSPRLAYYRPACPETVGNSAERPET